MERNEATAKHVACPAVSGCCLVSFHVLWAILSTSTVDKDLTMRGTWPCPVTVAPGEQATKMFPVSAQKERHRDRIFVKETRSFLSLFLAAVHTEMQTSPSLSLPFPLPPLSDFLSHLRKEYRGCMQREREC